jgi:uncharacterized integral membrane protein
MVPLALFVVVFSVTNRDSVALDLWPTPFAVQAPVFVVVLLSALAGFVVGALALWVSGGNDRRRARRMARRARDVEQQLAILREQMADANAPSGPDSKRLPVPADAV